MVQNNELPESESYDIENWTEDDFFGPAQDFIPEKVRQREASETSQQGESNLLGQNGTEAEMDKGNEEETILEAAILAQGAGTSAQGASSMVQGVEVTTQGAVTSVQGTGVGLGPPVISGTASKPKTLSKHDIRHFFSTGPGSDGYIMRLEQVGELNRVQRVHACYDALAKNGQHVQMAGELHNSWLQYFSITAKEY